MRIRTFILLALTAVAGCSGPPPRVASADLAGIWVNPDGVSMTCQVTGLVVIDRPGPKARPVIGEYTFDGTHATFRSRPESKLCADEVGQYEARVNGDACVLTLVRDACADRARLLQGSWTRTAPDRAGARD